MNGANKVWDAAEAFRRQYLAQAGGVLPVDVFPSWSCNCDST